MDIDQETFDHVVTEHGHLCPGLAVGVHAAHVLAREFGGGDDVTVAAERDNCIVDAMRILTGCTYAAAEPGEEGLLLSRPDGRRVRFAIRDGAFPRDPEVERLRIEVRTGEASDEERERFRQLQSDRAHAVLALPTEELIDVAVEGGA